MALFYPHKQTVLIAAICALSVAGTALYVYSHTPSGAEAPAATKALGAASADGVLSADLAADTSTDWKKAFFSGTVATEKKPAAASDQPLTLTDQMSRDFFTRYMALHQANATNDQQSVQKAVDQTIVNAVGAAPQPKAYVSSDIAISADTSATALRAYANAVGDAFNRYGPRDNPTIIASDALDQNDFGSLSRIDPIISAYKTLTTALLRIPAPRPLATQHVALVNGTSAMLYVSQGLHGIENDPMQGMVALGTYETAVSTVEGAVKNIQNYLDSAGISFSDKEPGAIFATNFTQ